MDIMLILKRARVLAASVVLTGAVLSGCSPADDSTQVEDTKGTTTTDTEETEPATEPDIAESDHGTDDKKPPKSTKVNPGDKKAECPIRVRPAEGITHLEDLRYEYPCKTKPIPPAEPGTLDECRAPKPDKHGKVEEDCHKTVPLGD